MHLQRSKLDPAAGLRRLLQVSLQDKTVLCQSEWNPRPKVWTANRLEKLASKDWVVGKRSVPR